VDFNLLDCNSFTC